VFRTRYLIPLKETAFSHLIADPVDGEYVGMTWRFVRAPGYDPSKDPKYNRRIKREVVTGKWLIFLSTSKEAFMAVWPKIKGATLEGKLGIAAKISNPRTARDRLVVCVYTRDYRDEADVMRVREVLRSMGFDRPLSYKPDYETLAGNYGSDTIAYRG
jgi:hypothetical protein